MTMTYILIAFILVLSLWALNGVVRTARRRGISTPLRGPKSKNLIWGLTAYIHQSSDSGEVYEKWADEYGPAYLVPAELGSKRVILCDAKAIAHFFSRETIEYVQTSLSKITLELLVRKDVATRLSS